MALLQEWRDKAYSETANKGDLQRLWTDYFQKERDIYAQLLKNPDEVVKGTVKELADKYGVDLMYMVGFLDGINDSLKEQNPIEEMDENTEVNLGFDKELLYKNMINAGADWLYNLPEWESIFDEEKRKELFERISIGDVQNRIQSYFEEQAARESAEETEEAALSEYLDRLDGIIFSNAVTTLISTVIALLLCRIWSRQMGSTAKG